MKTWELSNNMRAVISPVNIQEIVSIGMFFGVGSQNENEDTNGITHLLEHVISERFLNDCSVIGGRANALTTKEYCCFFSKSSNIQLEAVLKCFRRICDYGYDETNIAKAKKTAINEMQSTDIEQSIDQQIFDEHLYGEPLRFLPMGKIENIERVSAKEIYSHFKNYIQPIHCVLSIVGFVDEDDCINIVERIFGDWLGNKSTQTTNPHDSFQKEKSGISSKLLISKSKTSSIRMLFDGVSRSSASKVAYSSLCNYLGGGTHSKLCQLVRESSMAYNAFCVPQYFLNRGIIYFKVVGISEKISVVMENISKLIIGLANKKISCEELQIVKKSMGEDHIFKHETLSSKMTLFGQQLLMDGYITTDKMIIDSINNVSSTEIESALNNILSGNITILFDNLENMEKQYFNRIFN